MKVFILFLSTVPVINAVLDICKVPPAEDWVKNSIPEEIDEEPPEHIEHACHLHHLIKSAGLHKDFVEAKKNVTFCDARVEKPEFPKKHNLLTATDTCSVVDRQIGIPKTVKIEGEKCKVLNTWAERRCSYVSCSSDNCEGVTPVKKKLVSDQYKCRPVNPRRVKVFALCYRLKTANHHHHRHRHHRHHAYDCSIKTFTIRLPQCCSCIRFVCGGK